MTELPRKGIYRHFKGNRYELMDFARHSETMEWMVVYRALYGEGGLWVRPLSMWTECVERDGVSVQRFTLEEPEEEYGREDFPEDIDYGADEAGASAEPFKQEEPDADPKRRILRRFYGYDSFREGQEEVVDAILSGRDTFAVMPTGAGKSICYQVPAMIMDGVALVISPLISLMKDQVQSLIQNGVPAAYLNSSLNERQMDLALNNILQGKYRIVYVAPERLLTPRFLSVVRGIRISMIAVDEAHCISQWGQDFRPSYLTIPEFLNSLNVRPVVCAFTATATENVRKDVCDMIGLKDPMIRITGFDRKNLYYSVREETNKNKALLALLKDYKGLSGIVYCATRKKVESVYELLLSSGYSVTRYHAGLTDEERQANQEDFSYDRREIMVATNAFGMGIDKSDVRFVIHYNMPKDIESYYQESGRAGRDGDRSDCHLLFGAQDVVTQRLLIDRMGEEAGLEGKELENVQAAARQRLTQMIRYCTSPGCLRKKLLEYFDENAPGDCSFCANCLLPPETEDRTVEAQSVVQCVDQTGERFGQTYIVDVLRGNENDRIYRFGHDRLLSYGVLHGLPENDVVQIIDRLLEMDALVSERMETPNGMFRIIRLGERADEVLAGELEVKLLVRPKPSRRSGGTKRANSAKKTLTPAIPESDLFGRLKTLRRKIAFARSVPPYIIFNDKVLSAMAELQPMSIEEMADVPGVGMTKLQEYGKTFLKEIVKYREEQGNDG